MAYRAMLHYFAPLISLNGLSHAKHNTKWRILILVALILIQFNSIHLLREPIRECDIDIRDVRAMCWQEVTSAFHSVLMLRSHYVSKARPVRAT